MERRRRRKKKVHTPRQAEVKEIKAEPADGHKVGSGGNLSQLIGNQRSEAAPSPEVGILNPVSALNGEANAAVGRLQSAGGALGIIEWLPR